MTQRIAIVGAGIGGLAAAALLHDQGRDVTVYDQFPSPRPIGSGLVIQPVGQMVLGRVGVLEEATALGMPITRMAGHEAEGKRPVLNVFYDPGGRGTHGLAIHRGSLFHVLWQAMVERGITVVPNAEAAGASNGLLRFADGTEAGPFDLIIDSAGAGSPLSPLKSRTLPYGAIWATVDWPDTGLPTNELRQCYRRADRMIGVLPIGQMPDGGTQKAALFWSLPSDGHANWLTEGLAPWKAEAIALWPDVAPFVDQITDPAQMTMARYSHGTMAKPYGAGLVHIGDSAHRASPQLGQGANMALLDALALAEALRLANGQDPLALYARARRWHVRTYQLFSAVFTPQYQSDSTVLPMIRDRLLYPLSQVGPVAGILNRLVCGTLLPPLASLEKR
ncbi:FAD-dependent oxidoreductase [Flavimaricola marinus]|uniref:FAD-dependent urate hydroxylase n=1 Tax=Flavimaricola marinus TaxID=1819565 RepID=A0A238LAP7_9RHOB|nr:NAD(P)/FAD-dependent oxidoreductase [Flavimaricola marinus]SMY06633.1 FAD-dependent urate hydroxylase [Flavimaricola marinus]